MACHREKHETKGGFVEFLSSKCHVCDLWSLFFGGISCPINACRA
jgi:hypothetical protein